MKNESFGTRMVSRMDRKIAYSVLDGIWPEFSRHDSLDRPPMEYILGNLADGRNARDFESRH